MRIAIPLSARRVSQHLGHSEQFLFVDTDEDERGILRRELVPAPEHVPGFLPEWLKANAVNVVIAAGLGSRARDLLTASSVTVVTGASEVDPDMLVASYLNGTLENGANGCDHSGHNCSH